MGNIAVTGAASGIGAATVARLRADGHRVLGIDLAGTDIDADLSGPDGRRRAAEVIEARCDGRLHGLVPCAGLAGVPTRPGGVLVAVNYFGTVDLVSSLRPALVAAGGAVVALSSNSTTTQPGYSQDLVAACLDGDEAAAVARGDEVGALEAYPATKLALARWVRRRAVDPDWGGAGIRLNAVAPGVTETAMVAEVRSDDLLGQFIDAFPVPVGRTGRPEEIAAAITFLLGPDAAYVQGTVLFVDGGTDALLRPDGYPTPP